MSEAHPPEATLVRFAFGETIGASESLPRHLAICAMCRNVIDTLRRHANVLRVGVASATESTDDCLDAESIAAFAEGTLDSADTQSAVTHLLSCHRCCMELAAVTRLLDAPGIKLEMNRISGLPEHPHRRRTISIAVAAAALAAGLVFLLVPPSTDVATSRYREVSVTGDAAPRLLAPLGASTPFDAFRWTSVPRADRYRITVFARDGTVIWEAQTRDTVIALPELVRRTPIDTILWRVQAHVGWEDRWAASDLAVLTMSGARR